MITAKLKTGVTLLTIVFLLISFTGNAQKIHFAKNEEVIPANDVIYVAGTENKNVFVWMYRYSRQLLQLNIYDSTMDLLAQKSLKLANCSYMRGIDFFQKNNVYEVLISYSAKDKVRTEVFSYDKTADNIKSTQVLSESTLSGGLVVKYSNDGKYTGLLQTYATKEDSTLIQYSLFGNRRLEKDIVFTLPYQHTRLGFESSMIDKSGNLFFIASTTHGDSLEEEITLYEVNPQKDSLLLNDIARTGRFGNLQIMQNNTTGHLNLSGTLTEVNRNKFGQLIPDKRQLFLMDLNNDLSQKGEMTLFAMDRIMDSIYGSSPDVSLQSVVLDKDSGYVFYSSGVMTSNKYSETGFYNMGKSDQYNSKANSNYYTAGSSDYSTGIGSSLDVGNFYRKPPAFGNQPMTGTNLYYDPISSYAANSASDYNYKNFGPSRHSVILSTGKNFFMAMSVGLNHINSLVHFTDSTPGVSFAEFEYITNTNNGIHYLYSRELKNRKQMLFDVVFDADGNATSNPVITNPKYTVLLRNGVQVSSNSIVFPYLYSTGSLSFAKLDIIRQ